MTLVRPRSIGLLSLPSFFCTLGDWGLQNVYPPCLRLPSESDRASLGLKSGICCLLQKLDVGSLEEEIKYNRDLGSHFPQKKKCLSPKQQRVDSISSAYHQLLVDFVTFHIYLLPLGPSSNDALTNQIDFPLKCVFKRNYSHRRLIFLGRKQCAWQFPLLLVVMRLDFRQSSSSSALIKMNRYCQLACLISSPSGIIMFMSGLCFCSAWAVVKTTQQGNRIS